MAQLPFLMLVPSCRFFYRWTFMCWGASGWAEGAIREKLHLSRLQTLLSISHPSSCPHRAVSEEFAKPPEFAFLHMHQVDRYRRGNDTVFWRAAATWWWRWRGLVAAGICFFHDWVWGCHYSSPRATQQHWIGAGLSVYLFLQVSAVV